MNALSLALAITFAMVSVALGAWLLWRQARARAQLEEVRRVYDARALDRMRQRAPLIVLAPVRGSDDNAGSSK